jgi:hypothetical protein
VTSISGSTLPASAAEEVDGVAGTTGRARLLLRFPGLALHVGRGGAPRPRACGVSVFRSAVCGVVERHGLAFHAGRGGAFRPRACGVSVIRRVVCGVVERHGKVAREANLHACLHVPHAVPIANPAPTLVACNEGVLVANVAGGVGHSHSRATRMDGEEEKRKGRTRKIEVEQGTMQLMHRLESIYLPRLEFAERTSISTSPYPRRVSGCALTIPSARERINKIDVSIKKDTGVNQMAGRVAP